MPWKSKKQQRWGHGRGGKEAGFSEKDIEEWDDKTDFKGLPEEAEAACGGRPVSSCTVVTCIRYGDCAEKAMTAACGSLPASSCTVESCAQFSACSFLNASTATVLNWGHHTLAEDLNWTGARPCTEGDDDSQYGPHGEDQKCTDEGGVPEGFQEVDPGGGDWEAEPDEDGGEFDVGEYLSVEDPYEEKPTPQKEQPMKKIMKEEEREAKQEKQREAVEKREHERTALPVSRDPRLGPEEYHQFWQPRERGLSDPAMLPGFRDWAIQKARKTLEERLTNPKHNEYAKTPEEREAITKFLMEGPKAGGGYEKKGARREEGDPYLEDYTEPGPSREPII